MHWISAPFEACRSLETKEKSSDMFQNVSVFLSWLRAQMLCNVHFSMYKYCNVQVLNYSRFCECSDFCKLYAVSANENGFRKIVFHSLMNTFLFLDSRNCSRFSKSCSHFRSFGYFWSKFKQHCVLYPRKSKQQKEQIKIPGCTYIS